MKQSRIFHSVTSIPLALILISLFLLFTGAITASAQSADKIVKEAGKALGGEKAQRSIKSWQVKGTIVSSKSGESGSFQAAALLPNLYTSTYDISGLEVSSGYNGKSAWVRDSRNGLRTMTGAESRDFQVEARWRNNLWLDYKKDKSKLTFAGRTEINGKAANSVILTTIKKKIVGVSSGNVTVQKRRIGFAPSMAAASSTLLGMACRPARKNRKL